jgi:hypothetical protein
MRRVSLLVLVLAAIARPLAAQVVPSPFRFLEKAQGLGVQAGYIFTDRGEFGTGPHSAPIVGLEYRGRFAGPLAGVVSVSYLPSERTVFGQGPSSTIQPLGDTDAHLIQAQAGLDFTITGPRTWHSLAPFVGASFGLVTDISGRSDIETEASLPETQLIDLGPAFAVGGWAGTDWFISDRFSVRAAGRGHLWRAKTPAGLAGREESEWLPNGGGTLGVAFHF